MQCAISGHLIFLTLTSIIFCYRSSFLTSVVCPMLLPCACIRHVRNLAAFAIIHLILLPTILLLLYSPCPQPCCIRQYPPHSATNNTTTAVFVMSATLLHSPVSTSFCCQEYYYCCPRLIPAFQCCSLGFHNTSPDMSAT